MKQSILALALLLAVGCNPRLISPTVDIPPRFAYQSGESVPLADSAYQATEWWRVFGDTTLNRLITTTLAQNNDLLVAASKITQAQQSLRQLRSQYLPSFSLGREVGISGQPTTQHYAIEPAASWEIPLFGSLRAATTQASAEVEYAQWQYRGVRLSLAAQVATTYYTLLKYQRDLIIAIESSRLRAQTAHLTDSLFVRGLATGLHREQALSLLYTAQADIPLYEQQVRQTMVTLTALTGSSVQDTTIYKQLEITRLTDSPSIDIPVGLPSDLLYRRADVASAYATLVASAAKAKQARIARLPTLMLTAEGGVVSDDISRLFKGDSWVWSTLLSFAQPIYRFGALKSQERAAVELYNQALYAYRQSFITALSEVESALVEIATTRRESERYRALIASNDRISTLTRALYGNGLASYLDVIDAERTLYNTQMEYSNIIAQQYLAYIKLYLSLGS